MPDISPIGSAAGGSTASAGVTNGVFREVEVKPRPSQQLSDSVELSDRARYLDYLRELPPVRKDVVEATRNAISSGEYSIDDKLGIAIDRLIEDLV